MSNGKENHDEYDASLEALLLSSAYVYPAVLNAAIELNLFEIISKGSPKGMSPSDIASKLPNPHPGAIGRLDRLLFLLSTHSLLTCSSEKSCDEDGGVVERLYGLSPIAKYLLPDEDGASYAAISRLSYHPTFTKVWQNFKEVIVGNDDEDLFKKVNGMSMYEYMETDPTLKPLFHRAMSDLSTIHMKLILETYKGFEGISTLVDVAGGTGQTLKMVISKYPSIKGINFDLPQVAQHAPSHPGITHVGGDMFEGVPEGDAIMLKSIIHNWTDEKCIQILKNCHASLKKDGKVIVIDMIMPETPTTTNGHKIVSIADNIMNLQAGGRERSEKEFQALCKAAGFSGYHVASRVLSSALGVIEFYK